MYPKEENYILQVKNLFIKNKKTGEKIIQDLNFFVEKHQCLAIVGESGSGKSMTAKSIIRMLPHNLTWSGQIIYKNKNMANLNSLELKTIRGKEIFIIFQDAMSAFDPSSSIEESFIEILKEHIDKSKKQLQEIMYLSLNKVHLKDAKNLIKKYPHQLSGGMLQRIVIAIAFALEPSLIIADEPTTALDTITQYEIIEEFLNLKKELNTSMIFISHDLGVVKRIADSILLLKRGNLVEKGLCQEILNSPKSEYGKYLIGNRHKIGKKYNELMGVK